MADTTLTNGNFWSTVFNTTIAAINDTDSVLVKAASGATDTIITAALLRAYLQKGITPSIGTDGYWYIGGVLIKDASGNPIQISAEGKTPTIAMKTIGGVKGLYLTYKGSSAEDTDWTLLVTATDLMFTFDELTDAQKQSFLTYFTDAVANCNTAAANANAATANCETATSKADTATDKANTAATAATTAASEATTAAANANAATANCETATSKADTATDKANTAATAATTAATEATTAASEATTATTNANAATANCETATSKADTATDKANTAATAATTAASEATTAAANVNAATANCETATSKANTATDNANTAATAATTAASEATTAAANANAAASSVENLSALYAYGVEWDTTVSSPDGTRIGNATLHHTLPVQNMMKGVLLGDDGTENQILNDATWIGQPLDGSKGQVMVKIPNYWFRCETDGTKFRFWESDHQLAGFTQFFDNKINYVYCSAYEAGLDRTNMALVSIVNSSTQYRGGNNTADWDGTYRSLLNMPATNISRTDFRTYARKRNSSANTCWNGYIYTIHVMISWLFFTEYATLNSQKDYNASLDSNGYKQGGLGAGVSNMYGWGTYNSYNPIIPNGVTDSLGNGSGVVTYNVIASDGTTTYYAAPVPRYRGIQNPFGHLWKWSDGINIKEDGTTRTAYVTTDMSKLSDSWYYYYENRGTISHSNDWVKTMLLGTFADLLAVTTGGSSSTYYCDYYSGNSNANLYGVLFGGIAHNGANVGFVCASTNTTASYADAYIGSRLCFVPSV